MLKRFKLEVTDRGNEACLPRNLSDEWLRVVAQSTDEMLAGGEGEKGAVALAAILSILSAKQGTNELRLSWEEMRKRFEEYRLELGLEEVHRKTEIKYEPATLDTIFTNREVKTWQGK